MHPDRVSDGVSRRQLLQWCSAAAVGAITVPRLVQALEQRARATHDRDAAARPPIGLQLYTVRALMGRDVDGTLAALAVAGVQEVEFAGYFDRAPSALRAVLDRHGLTAPAAHVPLPASPAEWTPVFDAAEALGHRWLVLPWVGNEVRASLDGWRRLADTLNEAGQRAAARGLRMAYHNHDFEFAVTEGAVAWDVFVDRLDPALVDLELDLYWALKAGQDPAALFAARPGRFPLWHLKDAGPAPQRTMRDVGAGTIDFAALFATGSTAGLRHGFIEHDTPPDPMGSVRASVAALQRLG
jgi:sugar phosphate isomerase/epimerase